MTRRLLTPDWQVAALTQRDTVLVKVLLACLAANRAADYVSNASVEHVGSIENALPMGYWVALCYIPALLLFVGITIRRHFIVFLGHAIGWVVYTALMVGAVLNTIAGWPPDPIDVNYALPLPVWAAMMSVLGGLPLLLAAAQRYGARITTASQGVALVALTFAIGDGLAAVSPFENMRTIGPLALIAVAHGLLGLRSGPYPLTEEEGVPEGIIQKGEA